MRFFTCVGPYSYMYKHIVSVLAVANHCECFAAHLLSSWQLLSRKFRRAIWNFPFSSFAGTPHVSEYVLKHVREASIDLLSAS